MSVQNSVLTAPAIAFAGLLYDDGPNSIITLRNAEASADMAFGSAVAWKVSSPVTDKDAVLPTTSTTKLAGIIVHAHNYAREFELPDGSEAGELAGDGLAPGAILNVLVSGRIYVQVRQTVVVGDPLFVCYSPDGTVYTVKGQIGNADVSSNAASYAKIGHFITSATALGFAVLDCDFVNAQ